MQQNPQCSQMTSPYMLWEYVNLMNPFNSHDYNIHPAFTSTSSQPKESIAFTQEQFMSNVNYRIHQEQHLHPTSNHRHGNNTVAYNVYQTKKETDQSKQNENQLRKKYGKIQVNSNRNKKGKPHPLTIPVETPSNQIIASSKKISSFTIDAILSKGDYNQSVESFTSPIPVTNPAKPFSDTAGNLTKFAASTPPKTTSCYPPLDDLFSISAPLMHSTPIQQSFRSNTTAQKCSHFMDVSHAHPYFLHQYDSHSSQQQHYSYQHHPHIVHSAQITPSLSSTSSSGSLSTPSSTATSPESTSTSSSVNTEKPDRKPGVKSKRIRTIFTPEQLERLEAEFERQQYMVGNERFYLATSLSLSEAQVKVWFQNRRIKWRKQHLEQQQARLAQGDLYRDLDEESGDSDTDDRKVICDANNDQSNKDNI